jgi:hypothetical protein
VSDRTAHGLIIGKCYPPHAGHELLVRTAAAVSERVSVLVLAHPDEALALGERVSWRAAGGAERGRGSGAGGGEGVGGFVGGSYGVVGPLGVDVDRGGVERGCVLGAFGLGA